MKNFVFPLLALAFLLSACTGPAAKVDESLPNIVMIYCDDLGYGDIGCYGAKKVKTPHIDRLAAEGVMFTDFHTAASICSPSRAAFLTGAYPQRAGLYMGINPNRTAHWFLGLHPDEITIADLGCGAGPLALRAVTELSLSADTVHLITPGPDMLATPLVKRLATDLKVVLWEGYSVQEIVGTAYAERILMESSDGAKAEIEADGIFIELGLIPNTEPVQGLVDLDDLGRVMIDNHNQTSCRGLFAACHGFREVLLF